MKHKRLILSLILLIISIVYLIYPCNNKNYKESFKDEIIRFHIKANSNKKEDQALKLKIRDEILKEMGDKFANSRSIEETRYIILNNIDNIKSISEDLIAKEGKDFPVDVSLGNRKFPTRKYGNITFPAGEYETLIDIHSHFGTALYDFQPSGNDRIHAQTQRKKNPNAQFFIFSPLLNKENYNKAVEGKYMQPNIPYKKIDYEPSKFIPY